MSSFWRAWFTLWCISVGIFGLVLAGGALEATSGPVRFLLSTLNSETVITFDPVLRFCLAVMGSVSIGWAVTLYLMIIAAIDLGARGRPLWNAITAGMVSWFVIDSILSVVTGFGLNVFGNAVLAGMYLIGLGGSGVLKQAD